MCVLWHVANCLSSLLAPTETVKQIIINIEAGVEVEVTIAA
jgi:small subunit ribosomal protein S20e